MKKVGIIAPSGNIENFSDTKVKIFFESKEIEVKIFPSCYEKFRYMAGCDTLRIDDIHSAFCDNSIDTIICARGGYGAIRLLNSIDYKLIKENQKPFVGFSDVTALLIAFYKQAGLKSFHGKMAINGVLNMDDIEFNSYLNSINNFSFQTKLTGGVLWGGNLATIVSLFGFDSELYIPNEDIILFIEDINEPDYKIDRMLTQILNNKKLLSKINGVIFGDFIGSGEYLVEIQHEFVQKLSVPFENNSLISHGNTNIIVPFGYKI